MAEGLQYRMASLSNAVVGIFWGVIQCIVFGVFFTYSDDSFNTNGMTFSSTMSYVWLAQSFLIFVNMTIDSEVMTMIKNGDVGIELCRPLDLYSHWFFKIAGGKLGTGWIRCALNLIAGILMPFGYALSAPASMLGFFMFVISIFLSFFLCMTFAMIIMAVRLNITWGDGPTYILMLISSVLSGIYLPLRLWPDFLQGILRYQPFGGFIDTPAQLYIGTITPDEALLPLTVQVFWIIVFLILGRFIMRLRLKNIIVQGG